MAILIQALLFTKKGFSKKRYQNNLKCVTKPMNNEAQNLYTTPIQNESSRGKSSQCDANGNFSLSKVDKICESSLVSPILPFPLSRTLDIESSILDKGKGKMNATNEDSDIPTSWDEEKFQIHHIPSIFRVRHYSLGKMTKKVIILILY